MSAVLKKVVAEEPRPITQMLSLALLCYRRVLFNLEPQVLLLTEFDKRREGDGVSLVLPSVEENSGKNDTLWLMNSVGASLPGVKYDIRQRLPHDIVGDEFSGSVSVRVYVGMWNSGTLAFGPNIVGYQWESCTPENLQKIRSNSLRTSSGICVSRVTFDVMNELQDAHE